LAEGKIVVCNRYISANMGHQGGKIENEEERRRFVEWLEDLEYNMFKIPKTDLTIFLYVPYQIAQSLVAKKIRREYIKHGDKDIHEKDLEHERNAELAFLDIAKEKNWKVIDCSKKGRILPVEEIHKMVLAEVRRLINSQQAVK
jgi:dTMP kinase